jgi:hypothetical protein
LRDIASLIQAFTPIATLIIGVISAGILASNPSIDKSLPGLIATGSIAMAGTAYQAQK